MPMAHESPVEDLDTGSTHPGPSPGIALCLSGGGFRAMLYHVGALWRLNEAGYLPHLDRISSVSGGSITAGLLGLRWTKLAFDAQGVAAGFQDQVVRPLFDFAGHSIDVGSIVKGVLLPGSIGHRVAAAYEKHLFGDATLQDLPPDPPRFVINATNVQTGSLFRFMRPAIRDWRLGEIPRPQTRLSLAVAASSAFPPVLSPLRLKFKLSDWSSLQGATLQDNDLKREVALTDGGVYDNLGLETAFKRYRTLLVSDAGMMMEPEAHQPGDWARHSMRMLALVDNQVRSLRRRQLMGALIDPPPQREGAFWTIGTPLASYPAPAVLSCPEGRTRELARTPTRLKAMEEPLRKRLINWGYASCDAAMRSYVRPGPAHPLGFPFPDEGV